MKTTVSSVKQMFILINQNKFTNELTDTYITTTILYLIFLFLMK